MADVLWARDEVIGETNEELGVPQGSKPFRIVTRNPLPGLGAVQRARHSNPVRVTLARRSHPSSNSSQTLAGGLKAAGFRSNVRH